MSKFSLMSAFPVSGRSRHENLGKSKVRFRPEADTSVFTITGMVNTVKHRHLAEIERIDALQAGNVIAKLVRIGAPLVMCIDAANGTEIVLGRHRVELIKT